MYYDGTKLLSMTDINGNKPEIYMCTSNRSAGKTTWFNRYAVKKYRNENKKFMLVFRFDYELDDCADKFFKEIRTLFFPQYNMFSRRKAKGKYHELYIGLNTDEEMEYELCGYAVALNSADKLKKYSHFFADTSMMIFDEFQAEDNKYCGDEIAKFISLHTSVARGGGNQVRYVPIYMIGNPVSIVNPYYVAMKISARLTAKTKFLKGRGFVLEQGFNESASKAQEQSAFNSAFCDNKYVAYSSQSIYLNDSNSFVEKMTGQSRYLFTLKYEGKDYGIREFSSEGIIYCDDKPDRSHPYKIATTTEDHAINYVMLRNNAYLISTLRFYFDNGALRFKNIQCKEACLSALAL